MSLVDNKAGLEEILNLINTLPNEMDTSDATATVSDILSGKSAYVNGQKIVGTLELEEGLLIASGTFTPASDTQQYTVTHALGKIPSIIAFWVTTQTASSISGYYNYKGMSISTLNTGLSENGSYASGFEILYSGSGGYRSNGNPTSPFGTSNYCLLSRTSSTLTFNYNRNSSGGGMKAGATYVWIAIA